jgi:hypothetical protein
MNQGDMKMGSTSRQEAGGRVATMPAAPSQSQLVADDRGATTLEWTLLLVALGIPAYWFAKMALDTLVAYDGMITTINGLPFP